MASRLDTDPQGDEHGVMAGARRRQATLIFATLAGALAMVQIACGVVAPATAPFAITLLLALAFSSYVVLGVLVVRRAGGHRIGWLLAAVGLLFLAGGASENLAKALVGAYGRGWTAAWLSWLDSWTWTAALGLVAAVILLFPTGRLPSRHWRPVGVVIVATTIVSMLEAALRPGRLDGGVHALNPMGFSPTAGVLAGAAAIAAPLSGAGVLASFASLVIRRRRASEVERQQLRWVTMALTFALASVPLVPLGVAADVPLAGIPFVLIVVVVPASVAVAVLRYRLYDLDLVINRVLVYALLIISVTALYVGLVVGAGLLFPGQVRSNLAATALASAVVALAVMPLRDVLRSLVARIILGHRATPYQVLSQFADHVHAGWTLDAVIPQMAALLADATGATLTVVYLRVTDDFSPVGVGPSGADVSSAPRLAVSPAGDIVSVPPDA